MTDSALIRAVAELWVDCGGDADGISYSCQRIRSEVERVIQEQSEETTDE